VEQALGADQARVRSGGQALTVSLLTLDSPVAAGDWVLVHAGFALRRLTADQVEDALAIRSTPSAPC
jgi:hydrogenase expression/formation protein HypC